MFSSAFQYYFSVPAVEQAFDHPSIVNVSSMDSNIVTFVVFSDTHNYHEGLTVPDGDVLLYSGDITGRPKNMQLDGFSQWLNDLPHEHKVVIGGNHDMQLEAMGYEKAKALFAPAIYLENSDVTINVKGKDIKIWGTPSSSRISRFSRNVAFQYEHVRYKTYKTEDTMDNDCYNIPNDVDIIMSHGELALNDVEPGEHVEQQLQHLKMIVNGHKHKNRIIEMIKHPSNPKQEIIHCNGSILDKYRLPNHSPYVIRIPIQ